MRKKAYKIKHFKTTYRKRRRSYFPKILLIVLCGAIVFVASYYLGGPLIDFIYDKITAPAPVSSDVPSPASSDETRPDITAECITVRAITEEELKNTSGYDSLLESLGDVKAVSVPLRTRDTMYFSTDKELALRAKIINEVNATELISKLKSKGIYVIGEFATFADSNSARLTYGTDMISMSVRFKGSPQYLCKIGENDYFLSPASDLTKEYISYLLADAAKTEVDEIILKDFCFIENDRAMFSENDDALDKSAILSDFYTDLQSEVSSVKISVEINESDLLPLNNNKYGNTADFPGSVIKADALSPSLIEYINSVDTKKVTRLGLSLPKNSDYSAIKDKLAYVIE